MLATSYLPHMVCILANLTFCGETHAEQNKEYQREVSSKKSSY